MVTAAVAALRRSVTLTALLVSTLLVVSALVPAAWCASPASASVSSPVSVVAEAIATKRVGVTATLLRSIGPWLPRAGLGLTDTVRDIAGQVVEKRLFSIVHVLDVAQKVVKVFGQLCRCMGFLLCRLLGCLPSALARGRGAILFMIMDAQLLDFFLDFFLVELLIRGLEVKL